MPKDLQVGDLVAYRMSKSGENGEEIINHMPYSASFLNWNRSLSGWKIKEYAVIDCVKKVAELFYQFGKYQNQLKSERPSA